MVIYFKIKFYRKISKALISLLSFFMLSCDFQNPAAFELPTWFFDLSFPLVQQKYSLEGMVDNKQIFSTPDSLGMQLMFERGLENGNEEGLHLFDGVCEKFKEFPNISLPHIGFNLVKQRDSKIWKNIPII